MAVFFDLDDEDVELPHDGLPPFGYAASDGSASGAGSAQYQDAERENPNQNSMTRALGCYPYASIFACFPLTGPRATEMLTGPNLASSCR